MRELQAVRLGDGAMSPADVARIDETVLTRTLPVRIVQQGGEVVATCAALGVEGRGPTKYAALTAMRRAADAHIRKSAR